MIYATWGLPGSGKSERLLSDLEISKRQHATVGVFSGAARYGEKEVRSRNGKAAALNVEQLSAELTFPVLLIDEAQFLSDDEVAVLQQLSAKGVIIRCYGLARDFRDELWEASVSIGRLAEDRGGNRSTGVLPCDVCGERRAVRIARVGEDGLFETEGPRVLLKSAVTYRNTCHACFSKGARGAG